ncbi:fumarylacetoacetate hydrolase family protein [Haloarcula sp. JP-L23]|uniref:fumarylacetoacetate hydrolase family protein n=1 Tax=Haloarcula sp. JP-L23 TaxID=2716717 RepID=UPI00140E97E2|nr:fumarylacetoacetate hydrolase family protein [Haloarcula sp. JP-L23]
MRFVRYTDGSSPSWGVQKESTIHALSDLPQGEPDLGDIGNSSYRSEIATLVEHGTLTQVDTAAVSLLAPVPQPGKIICCGLNYRDHAEEQDEEIPERPMLFGKAATSVTNPGDPIVHPDPDGEEQVDYEVELGVVVGERCKDVSESEAYDHIAGYTIINDVSGRTAQQSDGQFFRGKSYDTFAPMGPTLVAGDGFDPNNVDVEMRVDGEVKQASNTDQFIFDVGDLVSYISQAMTLRPGDVISTGTPGGVGIFRDPVEVLEPGQTTEAEIEGIGTLTNTVVSK